MFASDLHFYNCDNCDENNQKLRGCREDLEHSYLYPDSWGEVKRCPRSFLLRNPSLTNLITLKYSVKKLNIKDVQSMPNSLFEALDYAQEGLNEKERSENSKDE